MTKSLQNHYPQLQENSSTVTFQISTRAKYIRISINKELQVKVTVPKRAKMVDAQKFFESKIPWVQNSLTKMNARRIASQNNAAQAAKKLSGAEFLSRTQYLISRCQELAQKHQLKTGKITLRKQKTIWGSCSAKNDISLNSNLVFLEDDLVDYVILHELAHIKVKNHSRKFWQELERMLPNAKMFDRKLKHHQPKFHVG